MLSKGTCAVWGQEYWKISQVLAQDKMGNATPSLLEHLFLKVEASNRFRKQSSSVKKLLTKKKKKKEIINYELK